MKSEKSNRVKKVLAIMACIMILFLAITFVIHRILLSKEKQMLTEAGYYNQTAACSQCFAKATMLCILSRRS